jgi:hypothetical protein
MEKKREGGREAVGEVFLASDPLYHCFSYWGWERGAAKVAIISVNHLPRSSTIDMQNLL